MSEPNIPRDQQLPDEPEQLTHEQAASLMGQFAYTRESFKRLGQAHVDLFKAEIGAIAKQAGTMAGLAAGAAGCGLVVAAMLYIGGFLFIGEWLFGSMGWGLAHGVILGIGIIVALILAALGGEAMAAVLSLIGAMIVVFVVALLTGSNIGYDLASQTAPNLAQPLGTPGVIALIAGALFGAILFTLLLARLGGRKGAIAGFFLGALLGALVGWLIAGAPWTLAPAIAFAITIGLISWPILNFIFSWPGINIEERFSNLAPRQSIEAVNETRTWLEEQWQTRQPKLGRK